MSDSTAEKAWRETKRFHAGDWATTERSAFFEGRASRDAEVDALVIAQRLLREQLAEAKRDVTSMKRGYDNAVHKMNQERFAKRDALKSLAEAHYVNVQAAIARYLAAAIRAVPVEPQQKEGNTYFDTLRDLDPGGTMTEIIDASEARVAQQKEGQS